MMKEEIFKRACKEFVPGENDSPEAIPYYRVAAGLRAVWGREFCDRFNHAFHQAFCRAGSVMEDQYQAAVQAVQYLVEHQQYPPEPYRESCYDSPPNEPTERDAREFFNGQYKNAFPGKRANSKHANELWQKNKEKAVQIMEENYQNRFRTYEIKIEGIERNNKKRNQEWIDKVHEMALFEDAVRNTIT